MDEKKNLIHLIYYIPVDDFTPIDEGKIKN
ncbi:hypothetical protein ES705_21257 [subsurface metagenome]